MMTLKGRLLGGVAYFINPGSTSTGGGGDPGTGGGGDPVPPPADGSVLHSFALSDWSGNGSVGFARVGVPFQKGHVPAGRRGYIERGGAVVDHQWTALLTFPDDGSWAFAAASIRDTAFTASERRSYDVVSATGTLPTGTGGSLPALLAAHDIKMVFSNVQQTDNSGTTARAASLTASLANHAATSTRVTKLDDTGTVTGAFKVWGMAGADTHLKTDSYIIPWFNANGTVYALETCPVVQQSWWSIPDKKRLRYDAAFMDGNTTLASWSGVDHGYGSHWAAVRKDADFNVARAYWIGGAMPTLNYEFDKVYWAKCPVVVPIRPTLTTAAFNDGSTLPTLTPCRAASFANDPNYQPAVEGIDGTGAIGTRGIVTNSAAKAFLRQTPYDRACNRGTAHDLFGVPMHNRSNRQRTQPGQSTPDTANTIIPLILDPKPAADYDFTARGLPAAQHAYFGNYPTYQDGYVMPEGGAAGWSHNYPDSSHFYSYGYTDYLIEPTPWVLDNAVIDWAMTSVQQQVAQSTAIRPLMLDDYRASGHPLFTSMPSVTYSGIFCWCYQNDGRAAAWAINLAGQACIAPDNHEASGFLRLINKHNADWVAQSLQYMPASQKAAGQFVDLASGGVPNYLLGPDAGVSTPFFPAVQTFCALQNYRMTGAEGFKSLGLMTANMPIRMVEQGGYYTVAYHYSGAQKVAPINFDTNDWVDPAQGGLADIAGSTSGTALTIESQYNEGFFGGCQLPLAVGDLVGFSRVFSSTSDAYAPIPSGVEEGKWYYVVEHSHVWAGYGDHDTVKISATPNGSPIDLGTNGLISVLLRPASAAASVATAPPDIPQGDCYVFMHRAAIDAAAFYGHPDAPAALAKFDAFLAPSDFGTFPPSALHFA